MNLSQLRYFQCLARTMHYTRAAEQLHVTQSTLSHEIIRLEQELGVPLFERNGRNKVLTRLGEEFLACVDETLSALDKGVSAMQLYSKGEGYIRIGMLPELGEYLVPDLVGRFLSQHPQKNIHVAFTTGITTTLIEGLRNKLHDVVFCMEPADSSDLALLPVCKEPLVLLTPLEHPLAGRDRVMLSETLSYPHIFYTKESHMLPLIQKQFNRLGQYPEIACKVLEGNVIAGLVAKGFGIAVLPLSEIYSHMKVKIIPIEDATDEREIYMAASPQTLTVPLFASFYQFAAESLKAAERQ